MTKGYWITFYRSITDLTALAAYATLAGPAIIAKGGRFLARDDRVKAYEQGIAQRVTVSEFDSVEQAVAAHDSPAYREALKALGNTCERDIRIVEGLEATHEAATEMEQGRRSSGADASQRDLKMTIDAIPALVWSTRADGSVDFVNQHYLDYVGLSPEQVRNWDWTAAVHPDDLSGLTATWRSLIASGKSGEAEARFRRADGEYRWLLARVNPLRDGNGNIVKWYGLNADIEDRKRAEIRLAGEKQVLEMIASGDPLREVLDALCRFFVGAAPDCHCGIYPIDWRGRIFQYGVAPSLPASYTDPIEGTPVAFDDSPRGQSISEKTQVIASDIGSDPRWMAAPCRAHVLEHGLRAVWSTPICSREGLVVGTVCVYQERPGSPSPHHQELIAHVARLASIAIERSQAETALRQSEFYLTEGQRISATGTFSWQVDTDELTVFSGTASHLRV